jgi:hypothetical protein
MMLAGRYVPNVGRATRNCQSILTYFLIYTRFTFGALGVSRIAAGQSGQRVAEGADGDIDSRLYNEKSEVRLALALRSAETDSGTPLRRAA